MWLVGVVVRRYIDFLILLIRTPIVSVFLQQHPYFLFIFKNVFFRSCSCTFFNIILCFKYYFHTVYTCINTHTGEYGRPTSAI